MAKSILWALRVRQEVHARMNQAITASETTLRQLVANRGVTWPSKRFLAAGKAPVFLENPLFHQRSALAGTVLIRWVNLEAAPDLLSGGANSDSLLPGHRLGH